MITLNSLKMNYLVSDLDIEDIKFINSSYPQDAAIDCATFSEAVDWLDTFVDNEESGDKPRMIWALQGLKDLLHDATAGAVKITIFQDRLPV